MYFPIIFTILLLFFYSCSQKETKPLSYGPQIIETQGFVVPKDSLKAPKIIQVDPNKLKKVPIGNPISTTPLFSNRVKAGIPKIVPVGEMIVKTIGKDTFSLPVTKSIKGKIVSVGTPEVVLVKDAYIKDQNPENFSSYTKLQGLKHLSIKCMLQDKEGNIWMGSAGGGVTKYDGKYFTHFSDKVGLVSNLISSIFEDKQGNIWMGSIGSGVSKYDGKNFTNYSEAEGFINNTVLSIIQDKMGNMWFATFGGASKFDGQNFTNYTTQQGLNNNELIKVIEDKTGNIWLGSFGSGACKFDGKSFSTFPKNEIWGNNEVYAIIQDKNNNLLFGLSEGGLIQYDGKSLIAYTEKEGLSINGIVSILEDHTGNLWIGTPGGGVNKFNGEYFTHLTEKEGLSNNLVFSILEDHIGNMWFGTQDGGVSKYNGKIFKHITQKEGLSNNTVYALNKDAKDNIWIGTKGGYLTIFDGKSFKTFKKDQGIIDPVINGITEDKNHNLWFCTDGGVMSFKDNIFTHYTPKDGLNYKFVYSQCEDSEGNMWFGTQGEGVSKFDGKSFTHFKAPNGLTDNTILSILKDKSGNIWFGSKSGITKYDGQNFTHFTEKEGLKNTFINTIYEDKAGNLWFGTYGGGVIKYDGKKFVYLTEKEGLMNNFVFSILEDKNNNIWFGTRFGLSKLTQTKNKLLSEKLKSNVWHENDVFFKNYGYDDGYLGIGNYRKSILEDKKGNIWMGSNERLSIYYPEEKIIDTTQISIHLTHLELFNETINWNGLSHNKDTSFVLGNGVKVGNFHFDSLNKVYKIPENLSLAYNNNFLTFNFVGITMNQPKKVKYQYKLEGLDENWSALTTRNEAPYGNLPHGSYVFKVNAMDCEGVWSKEYIYTFTIRPPWWKTWWFRGFLLFSAFFLIVYYIRWREAKLILEKEILEKTVQERTADLKEAIVEIQSQSEEIITQSEEIQQQNDILSEQQIEIQKQNHELARKNSQIMDSISYGKRIQTAMLPEEASLKKIIQDSFIYFQPKEIVSGDFYWFNEVEIDGKISQIIAVVDCTGHGVPGAFMSMIGNELLNKIILERDIYQPDLILNELHKGVRKALKQDQNASYDGMDLGLIRIDKWDNKMYFAGAMNPLYYVQNNQFFIVDANKINIGGKQMEEERIFKLNTIELTSPTQFYLVSDGFQDQFGEKTGRKFMVKKFRELLFEINTFPQNEQKLILEKTLNEWKGAIEQMDDVLILGGIA